MPTALGLIIGTFRKAFEVLFWPQIILLFNLSDFSQIYYKVKVENLKFLDVKKSLFTFKIKFNLSSEFPQFSR